MAVFPSAYHVVLPQRYTQTTSFLSWFKLDGPTLLLPTACYSARLGSRLLREALLPIAFLAAVLLCGYLRGRMQRTSAPMTIGLPAALWLSFVLVPKVSGAIFRAWDCAAFPYDDAAEAVRFQLRADLAVRCSDPTYQSEAHAEVVRRAFALLWLWPVGAPAFFTLLLLRCRTDILEGRSTALARATSFLHQDYKPRFFFWEPVEMMRRLSITGFVLLVQDAQHCLYLAVMLSSGFVIMLAYLRPYAKPINNMLALCAQLAITSVFVAGIFLRLFAGFEKGLSGDRQQLQRVFGFDATASIINTLVGFNFGFLALLTVASLYQATHGAHEAELDTSSPRLRRERRKLADDGRPLMDDASGGTSEGDMELQQLKP